MKTSLIFVAAVSVLSVACASATEEDSASSESQIFQCMAMPACEPGDEAVKSESECPQDARCYTASMCGKTLVCTGPKKEQPPVMCLAIPTCDGDDTQVSGPSGCLQDDAKCYSRSQCGRTIWCTGPIDAPTQQK